jgi:hypothetical protein
VSVTNDELEALRAAIAAAGVLASAIPIVLRAAPPWDVAEIVVQDEFTHDVVLVSPGESRALVLDCT